MKITLRLDDTTVVSDNEDRNACGEPCPYLKRTWYFGFKCELFDSELKKITGTDVPLRCGACYMLEVG